MKKSKIKPTKKLFLFIKYLKLEKYKLKTYFLILHLLAFQSRSNKHQQ